MACHLQCVLFVEMLHDMPSGVSLLRQSQKCYQYIQQDDGYSCSTVPQVLVLCALICSPHAVCHCKGSVLTNTRAGSNLRAMSRLQNCGSMAPYGGSSLPGDMRVTQPGSKATQHECSLTAVGSSNAGRPPVCQFVGKQNIAQLALAIRLPGRVLPVLEVQVIQVKAIHLMR